MKTNGQVNGSISEKSLIHGLSASAITKLFKTKFDKQPRPKSMISKKENIFSINKEG